MCFIGLGALRCFNGLGGFGVQFDEAACVFH